MKILDRLKTYYSKKSRLALAFDILFYLFILLLIIPPTRMKLASLILRGTLHQPIFSGSTDSVSIYSENLNWELISSSGEHVKLMEEVDSVIFLNFWATWCPPCIAEMPSIQRLYDEYGDRVIFILVSQESPQTVEAFLKKNGYSLPTHSPLNQIPEIFSHRSIPTTFIITRTGEIAMRHKGATKWDGNKIKGLLDELINE